MKKFNYFAHTGGRGMSSLKMVVFPFFLVVLMIGSLRAQDTKGFNYQAVLRDAAGNILADHDVGLRFRILDGAADGTVVYEETHTVTTNSKGLVQVVIGKGTPVTGSFGDIDWSKGPYSLEVSVDINGGDDYNVLGADPLVSVPYAEFAGKVLDKDDADADPQNEIQDLQVNGNILTITGKSDATPIDLSPYLDNPGWQKNGDTLAHVTGSVAVGTDTPLGSKLAVQGDDVTSDDPLFEVKRKDGQTVFAVYNEGVRIYVGTDDEGKGPHRSGFAIGGFGMSKEEAPELMRVTPDSVRIYINNTDAKGLRGGFAIGGYDFGKGTAYEFMHISPDSVRINIGDPAGKGLRGGFAIGGYDFGKGEAKDYFKINDALQVDVVDPSQPRILWYPQKEAFLTGRVLVESPDSVGTNSFASGYESKAVGDYSQALGYQAHAGGEVATAIGRKAQANGYLSYAFGDSTQALGDGSYAIGTGASATGLKSFALGSTGKNPLNGQPIQAPVATGDYSYALGMGSVSSGVGSFALGLQAQASGAFSFSLGFGTRAEGPRSLAIGDGSLASSWYSVAVGEGAVAEGEGAVAIGQSSKAAGDHSYCLADDGVTNGYNSAAIGTNLTTHSPAEIVVGAYNDPSSFPQSSSWDGEDPVFVVGNGRFIYPSTTLRHNALVVLKNGKIGMGADIPEAHLEINADAVNNDQEQLLRLAVKDDPNSFFDVSNITKDNGVFAPMFRGVNNTSGIKPSLYFIGQTKADLDDPGNETPVLVFDARRDGDSIYNRALFQWSSYGHKKMTMLANGMLGIGTETPDKLLTVNGDARITGELFYGTGDDTYVKPDYVFEKEYDRNYSIAEVEHFIRENKHLPWMTAATDERGGVNLTRMNFEMLETVENLQLQIISLHKQLAQERQENMQKEETLVRLLKEQRKMIDLLSRKVEALLAQEE